MLSEEELREWERLCEGATPGRWYDMAALGWPAEAGTVRGRDGRTLRRAEEDKGKEAAANAAFIAAARTALPALLAEIRHLKALLAARREEE